MERYPNFPTSLVAQKRDAWHHTPINDILVLVAPNNVDKQPIDLQLLSLNKLSQWNCTIAYA